MDLVLFHSPCNDGFGAALCAWSYFGSSARYVPVSYLTKRPEIDGATRVYLLDFCYPRDYLLEMRSKVEVIVLDHHKTNFDMVGDLDFCTFDMGRSGAMMAWDYFSALTDRKIEEEDLGFTYQFLRKRFDNLRPLIEHIQDRDLYLNKLPKSREVFFALSSLPLDFSVWSGYRLEELIKEGDFITRVVDRLVGSNIKHSFLSDWFEGYSGIPVVNSTMTVYNTDVCRALLEKYPKAPFACTYFRLRDGRYKWSLRSRGEVDVALIAEKFEGGGHKGASSFASEYGG